MALKTESVKSHLVEHLRFFAELGVEGLSTDPSWRERVGPAATAAAPPADSGPPVVEYFQSAVPAPPAHAAADPVLAGEARTPAGALASIRTEIGDCTRCRLHAGRTNLVFGVGSPESDLMFVGEGPGAEEDAQGEPFVGRAGQLLTQIIRAMGYERGEVYIANVVKCRPPGNRNPEPDEIAECQPFLMRQIDVIRPRVIVALGKFAAQTILGTDAPISRLRGRFHALGDAQVMPTFHPSYLLRTPSAKREVWDDMKQVMEVLKEENRQ